MGCLSDRIKSKRYASRQRQNHISFTVVVVVVTVVITICITTPFKSNAFFLVTNTESSRIWNSVHSCYGEKNYQQIFSFVLSSTRRLDNVCEEKTPNVEKGDGDCVFSASLSRKCENDNNPWHKTSTQQPILQQTKESSQQQKLLSSYSYVELPIWLARYYSTIHANSGGSNDLLGNDWKHYNRRILIEQKTKELESVLLKHCELSLADVKEIIDSIFTTSESVCTSLSMSFKSDPETSITGMILGIIDFVKLILETVTHETDYSITTNEIIKPTKEMLIASVIHYVECTSAQQAGTTQIVKNALFRRQTNIPQRGHTQSLQLNPGPDFDKVDDMRQNRSPNSLVALNSQHDIPFESIENQSKERCASTDLHAFSQAQPVIMLNPNFGCSNVNDEKVFDKNLDSNNHNTQDQSFSEHEIWSIAHGSARIKRAEVLLQALSENQPTPALSKEDASRIRGLLLTVGGDWRSLAMRCVACLFRLEGILQTMPCGVNEYQTLQNMRNFEVVRNAREGLRIYSTLSEQLGLHRLKTRIEDRAFRILYRRQYAAVKSLFASANAGYNQSLPNVCYFLQTHTLRLLQADFTLMSQLDDLQVLARVKEPYSFWRKILKTKKETNWKLTRLPNSPSKSGEMSSFEKPTSTLAVADVHDTVALRVIFRARPQPENESEESLYSREESLCYYIQDLLLKEWPMVDASRMKDYVKKPKPNGYKSLHFTAHYGYNFPFEVQIRSEEMHNMAEYGVASHWGYKAGPTPFVLASQQTPSDSVDAEFIQGKVNLLQPSRSHHDRLDTSAITGEHITRSTRNSYLASLEVVRRDMVQHQVYVFTATTDPHCDPDTNADVLTKIQSRQGKLLLLPVNSTVRDAVASMNCVEIAFGDSAAPSQGLHVLRNGRATTLDSAVGNGDILMIQL